MRDNQGLLSQPTMLSAAIRFRWLVLGVTLSITLAAAIFGITRNVEYRASGTMVIEDPNEASALFSGTAGRADRYLQDQILIIQSGTVAAAAVEVLDQTDQREMLSATDIQTGLSVEGFPTSNLLLVTFVAESQELAVAAADAVARAYQSVVQAEQRAEAEGALAEIDGAIDSIEASIDEVDLEIAAARSAAPARGELEAQLEAAIQEIVELQEELSSGPTIGRSNEIRERLADLQTQISTVEAIRVVDSSDPQIAALQEERRALIERRSALTTSRNDITIQSQLASTGVSFYSPPLTAVETRSFGLTRLIAVGLIVGAALGVSLAYILATRNRVFTSRNEPQLVVEAPLLADVPDFSEERIQTPLPTIDAPRTAVAEAYRFAAASLDNTDASIRTISVQSPLNGSGKTTTVANLGFAMAGEGRRVLFIDADFGNQELTRILSAAAGGSAEIPVGLTDIIPTQQPVAHGIQELSVGGIAFSLLSRGRRPVVAIEFFRSPEVRQYLRRIAKEYDLILIDGPPLLQVAYSSTLATLSDHSLLVIEHASPVRQTEDMVSRLESIQAKTIGYVYNKAPLRHEMTVVEGSMHDILGSQGLPA